MLVFRSILITTCSLVSLNAWATDLYVSTSGSDSSPGTQDAPFRTIQKGADAAIPGTTIHVAAGTYSETLVTTVVGTALKRIRFVSDKQWGAKIVPNGAYTMWSVQGGYTDIDGFQIDGTGGTSTRAGIYLNGGNSTVTNSLVMHVAENSGCDNKGGAGLVADQGRGSAYQNYDFTNNIVHHVGGGCGWIQGIYHSSSGNIKNNIVYATSQGINMGHDDHNINVVNNTLFGNSGYGVYFGGCQEAYNNGCPTSGINIYNNIIYDNSGGISGPVTAEDVGNQIKNNLVYGNKLQYDLASPSASSMTGAINADPQFVNYIRTGGGDYHLKSSSPAIDTGSSTNAPSRDIDGMVRPQGAGIDIGAYEYSLVLTSPPAPIMSLSSKSIAFPGQLINTTSAVQLVTVTNSGNADLIFNTVYNMTGDFDFGGVGTCAPNFAYAPGTSCTVSIVFKPTISGTRSGVLSIPSNASLNPQSVALSGLGISPNLDTTAPFTAITAPAKSSYVAARTYVTIKAQASDNVGVKTVKFYVNGSLKCSTSAVPYQCVWSVPRTRGLTYSLQTKAFDAAGNVGVSSTVSVTSK